MKHIKTDEDGVVSKRVVAIFVMTTITDFSDQLSESGCLVYQF